MKEAHNALKICFKLKLIPLLNSEAFHFTALTVVTPRSSHKQDRYVLHAYRY